MNSLTYDLLFIVVAAATALFFYRYLNKDRKSFLRFRNRILIPVVAAGGMILYSIGYCAEGTADSAVTLLIRSFMSTFHMFFLHSDLIEVRHSMHQSGVYMFFFALIHLMAFIISFMIVIQLFGKRYLSRLRLRRSRADHCYLFFGATEAAFSLAADLLKNDISRQVVLIGKSAPDTAAARYEQAERIGAVWIDDDYDAEHTWQQLGIATCFCEKQIRLFFFSDNGDRNIRTALRALHDLNTCRPVPTSVSLYILSELEELPEAICKEIKKMSPGAEIHLVNRADLTADDLLAEYPPVRYLPVDTTQALALSGFHVAVIGLGQSGTSLLLNLVEYGQFPGTQFRALAVDHNMAVARGTLENRCPGLKHYDIQYLESEAGSTSYFEALESRIDTLSCAIVTLGDDTASIQAARELQRFITARTDRPVDILVQVYDNHAYDYLHTDTEGEVRIRPFGRHKNIFTEAVVVRENHYEMARQIHQNYCTGKTGQESWTELSDVKKKSNLSVAAHILTKLALAGLTPAQVRNFAGPGEFVTFLGEERFENLARCEHEHWNAVLFTSGWDTWPLGQIPPAAVRNKDERRRLHACLVGWDELTAVGARFKTDYRTYDFQNVQKIYELIRDVKDETTGENDRPGQA